jgi:hypothetical protein
MSKPASDAQGLLSSLGRLVRGLSALFWGLPIALVVCVQTAKTDWLQSLGMVPPLVSLGLLYYGLTQLGYFQKQERIWRTALERAKIFSLINLGLSPFLYWSNRMPSNPFFTAVIELLVVTGLAFLFCLNLLLRRLAAMLPDETLRLETGLFTKMNNGLLLATGFIFAAYFVLSRFQDFPRFILYLLHVLNHGGIWIIMFIILLPIAMTMALIWKMKEVILASVFSSPPPNQ